MPQLTNKKTGKVYHVSNEDFAKLPSNVLKAFKVKQAEEPDVVKAMKAKAALTNKK